MTATTPLTSRRRGCSGRCAATKGRGCGLTKTYAAREGYDIDASRELLGLGAANLGAGLTSGMVVNGSLSKTAVNGGAGAKSQMSGLDHFGGVKGRPNMRPS